MDLTEYELECLIIIASDTQMCIGCANDNAHCEGGYGIFCSCECVSLACLHNREMCWLCHS